jgi:hypothetical protein
MTIKELKESNLIVYECLSGSHAYGLNTPESDIDIKGVFIAPESDFFGLGSIDQVNDESNDTVYYELERFMELLSKNNPNILELLYSPSDCIRRIHDSFRPLRDENFLSKLCEKSFGGYAMTQIKKAKGLNKKILNPVGKERKGILDFCYVFFEQSAIPLKEFLKTNSMDQAKCGLSRISHMPGNYGIYYGLEGYRGIASSDMANDISLSSIPSGAKAIAIMSFNQSAYSSYCKEYKEYWQWVEKRNDDRFKNTLSHGKNYDAKNMMHTIRLLSMAEEIGGMGQLKVRRDDREYLLRIKKGEFSYEELVSIAELKIERAESLFAGSTLPARPQIDLINRYLINIRKAFYESH